MAINPAEYALEKCEIAAWKDFFMAAPPNSQHDLGIQIVDLGEAAGMFTTEADVLALNRIIGVGTFAPVSEGLIEQVTAAFQSSGAKRMFLQIHPGAKPFDLVSTIENVGFAHYNNWYKLFHDLKTVPDTETNLRIQRIGPEYASSFAKIVVECFEWPIDAIPWLATTVGRQKWVHYLAFQGDKPVATAAMYVDKAESWLDFATTLPAYRKLGAQSALLAARLRDAKQLACRRAQVETAEPKPDKVAASLRNVRSLGFQVAYTRANYVLQAKP